MRSPLPPPLRVGLLALWLSLTAAQAQAQTPAPQPPTTTAPAVAPGGDAPSDDAADAPQLTLSGFGTLGWARSNRDWAYQRFIDRRGGLERDSVLGAQADLRLGDAWSATVQAKLAPSESSDDGWRVTPAWAFVAWRPSNDWLLRAGKLRVPVFLRSEQLDVGATYDEARLPTDIYGIVPTTDYRGLHLTRSWDVADGELSLDAYHGSARQTKRVWIRQGLPGVIESGAMFRQVDTRATGLVATWTGSRDGKLRAGLLHVRLKSRDGSELPVRPTWVSLGPGLGFWTDRPGYGASTTRHFENTMLTLGTEFSPGPGWKVTGEFGRIRQLNTERSIDSTGGYLTVSREIAAFTPYLTVSRLFSSSASRAWARRFDETTLPAGMPGAAPLNASMRISADSVPVYDQRSWAVGGAYALSPTHKLKAEWMRTRSKVSSMLDLPAGESLFRPRSVDVLSLSYSFVF
jgi:hypothetical protein